MHLNAWLTCVIQLNGVTSNPDFQTDTWKADWVLNSWVKILRSVCVSCWVLELHSFQISKIMNEIIFYEHYFKAQLPKMTTSMIPLLESLFPLSISLLLSQSFSVSLSLPFSHLVSSVLGATIVITRLVETFICLKSASFILTWLSNLSTSDLEEFKIQSGIFSASDPYSFLSYFYSFPCLYFTFI